MVNWLIIGLVGIGGIVISLFFEEGREWWSEILEYIFSFGWLEDAWEFMTGLFEDLGDFSIAGLVFGVLTVVFVYLLRNQMLIPFLNHMGRVEYILWGGATYLGTGIAGYLVGRKLFEE